MSQITKPGAGGTPSNIAFNWTNVTTSPYVVNNTLPPVDYYLSVNTISIPITIELPNAPYELYEIWIIKDRTGNASVEPITVTTVGGTILIDGSPTLVMNGDFDSIQLLWNGTSFETF